MTATQEQDPILAELNGALAKAVEPVVLDPQGAQPPSLAEQLETKRAPSAKETHAQPRAANLDKVYSKKAGGFGYRVTVEGEYYAKSTEAKGHVIKPYRLPFNLPSLTNAKGEAALGIIVGKLLKKALKKLDPLAETFRTHAIVATEPLQGAPEPTSLQYMSFDALRAYVRESLPDFPLDPDTYWDVNHLREDVIDFKTNATGDVRNEDGSVSKGGFGVKKTVAERLIEKFEVRKEEKELAEMNEGIAE